MDMFNSMDKRKLPWKHCMMDTLLIQSELRAAAAASKKWETVQIAYWRGAWKTRLKHNFVHGLNEVLIFFPCLAIEFTIDDAIMKPAHHSVITGLSIDLRIERA